MFAAYRARRFTQRDWDRWIDSVSAQWPVTITHKSPLLLNTNGDHAYRYGQEFSIGVDAPNWIQARKYVDACLQPVLAKEYIIYPSTQDGKISKIGEELSRLTVDNETAGEDYEPSYPEIQFGASGRDETVGIVRFDIADSQVETIISQAEKAVQNEHPGLFSPHIPLQSESADEQLTEAIEQIRSEDIFATVDLTGDEDNSESPTTSLVFVVSESGARRLGNAIETIDESDIKSDPDSDSDSDSDSELKSELELEFESANTNKALVHPELVKEHTQQLIELASIALETDGRGVVGSIPTNDDVPMNLDWVRKHEPSNLPIEMLGFRAEFTTEGKETDELTDEPVFMVEASTDAKQEDNGQRVTEEKDEEHGNGKQEQEQEQGENGQEKQQERAHYRISVELAADEILPKQFDATYVNDVPTNSLSNNGKGLHVPNPEVSLFVDIALDPSREKDLQHSLEEIDVSNRTAEIAVFKAPVESDSIHQELIIELFPHFKLVALRNELRPLIKDVGGEICTEELPYFAKYGTEEPYYVTYDTSSLTNPERSLTSDESYYNERRIELMHAHTDYRGSINAESLTLSPTGIKTGVES